MEISFACGICTIGANDNSIRSKPNICMTHDQQLVNLKITSASDLRPPVYFNLNIVNTILLDTAYKLSGNVRKTHAHGEF